MSIIAILLIILVAMFALAELLRYFRVPRVVSHVLTGMVFGLPVISERLFSLSNVSVIESVAEIGVITLLFFVGLKLNIRHLRKDLLPSASVSFFNTALPMVLGYLSGRYIFGLSSGESLIVGLCMGVSAVALALDILEEFNKLKTKLGKFIITAGAFDDFAEMVLITILLTFLQSSASQTSLLELAASLVFFVIIVFVFRIWFIPWILRLAEEQPDRSLVFTGVLIITFLLSVLAEFLGVGAHLGALFSGVLVRQALLKDAGHKPWEQAEITHSMHTIAFGFLVPFFFFNVGLQTNLHVIAENWPFSLVITILAVAGTVIGSAIGYYVIKKNWNEGLIVGWAMNAKGDTELVIAKFALAAGVISSTVYSSLIVMAVISTLISPYVLKSLMLTRNK